MWAAEAEVGREQEQARARAPLRGPGLEPELSSRREAPTGAFDGEGQDIGEDIVEAKVGESDEEERTLAEESGGLVVL